MAKQAALAFVKRTLARCVEFEVTGKSCFGEPLFREMFLSSSSQLSDAQQMHVTRDGESETHYGIASRPSREGRISGIVYVNFFTSFWTFLLLPCHAKSRISF